MIFEESFVEVSLFTDLDPEGIDDFLILLVENDFTVFDFNWLCPFSEDMIKATD